jgi:nitroreductase
MMDVVKAIESRKSIRAYRQEGVDEELIKELIEAARLAPSARNTQALRFKLVRSERVKQRLKAEGVFPQEFVYTAPVLLFCYGDVNAYSGDDKERNLRWLLSDFGIQTAFLVLRATELGLSTCYVGKLDSEKAKGVLGISKEAMLPYAITVGYAAEEGEQRSRLMPEELIEELV